MPGYTGNGRASVFFGPVRPANRARCSAGIVAGISCVFGAFTSVNPSMSSQLDTVLYSKLRNTRMGRVVRSAQLAQVALAGPLSARPYWAAERGERLKVHTTDPGSQQPQKGAHRTRTGRGSSSSWSVRIRTAPTACRRTAASRLAAARPTRSASTTRWRRVTTRGCTSARRCSSRTLAASTARACASSPCRAASGSRSPSATPS